MRRWIIGCALLLIGGGLTFGLVTSCASMGKQPYGERLERNKQSPEWHDDQFENPEGMWRNFVYAMRLALFEAPDESTPKTPVPHIFTDPKTYAAAPESGLRITWFGHSSTLIEIDGVRILTDPIWSDRASPVDWAGPKRWYDPPLALDDLPKIDVIVVSHDHYDHCDRASLTALATKGTRIITPVGIGSHLEYWGIPVSQVTELDWWQSAKVGDIEVNAVPARHASGRINPQSGQTLWAGYAFVGPTHRVYYSGDTGFQAAFETIGEKLGPFDVTLIESGQYSQGWPDWHLGPEQAVEAHRRVRGKIMIPVHWALFNLAPHNWTEPVERVLAKAECYGVDVQTPRPGEPVEPTAKAATWHWWPNVEWRRGEDNPVIATHNGDLNDKFELPACTK